MNGPENQNIEPPLHTTITKTNEDKTKTEQLKNTQKWVRSSFRNDSKKNYSQFITVTLVPVTVSSL
jgi:hypothetical protein